MRYTYVLVYFWNTLPVCDRQTEIIEKIEKQFSNELTIISINICEQQRLQKIFQVNRVPTLIAFYKGILVELGIQRKRDRLEGLIDYEPLEFMVKNFIQSHLYALYVPQIVMKVKCEEYQLGDGCLFPEETMALLELKQIVGKSITEVYSFEQEVMERIQNYIVIKVANKHVIGLGIMNTRLEELPGSLEQLPMLKKLFLYNIPLKSLPNFFCHFISLKKLWLWNNRLTELPEAFGNLQTLQSLYIQFNPLRGLPESFGQLLSLKELHIYGCSLAVIPETFKQLISLKILNLSYNQLQTLPKFFANFTTLDDFYIRENPLSLEAIALVKELKRNNKQIDLIIEDSEKFKHPKRKPYYEPLGLIDKYWRYEII